MEDVGISEALPLTEVDSTCFKLNSLILASFYGLLTTVMVLNGRILHVLFILYFYSRFFKDEVCHFLRNHFRNIKCFLSQHKVAKLYEDFDKVDPYSYK